MYEFILRCFGFMKSFWHFMKMSCVFCIMLFLLFWIQNLTNSHWAWMDFITPFFNSLLEVSSRIYSISINLLGAVFEFKYLSALIILIALYFCMHFLGILTVILEGAFRGTHFICKKTEEAVMNKGFSERVKKQEESIHRYVVVIHTKVRMKPRQTATNVDLEAQNRSMIQYMQERTGKMPELYEDGFRYSFDEYNKIDDVLDVLFELLNSNAPIEYAICIQSGDFIKNGLKQLKKLMELKYYGKVIMAADTSFRYKYNSIQRYQTSQIGVFQCGDKTLEVHEFTKP